MKKILFIALSCFYQLSFASDSICYGETKRGKLVGGEKLPNNGVNFTSYSVLGGVLGRTYVHSTVHTVFIESFKNLETQLPGRIFKYAETGFEQGGPFKPHKTHQNGLSVDFMVPVLNAHGQSVYFPTTAFNKFGYAIEFSEQGQFKDYTIDYEALAGHIVALDKVAKQHGLRLWRIIFDPALQPRLFATQFGDYLRANIQFNQKRSWVRHDEHYHVDFDIPCEKL